MVRPGFFSLGTTVVPIENKVYYVIMNTTQLVALTVLSDTKNVLKN